MLSFCSYVNWVPNSDVVVGQNRGNLCVWYHIEAPERVTVVPIKGDVEDIERSAGKTEVVVDEGMNTVSYELNDALIAFSTAVDEGDLKGACAMLERLELTGETEAMWEKLSQLALEREDILTAERCFGAVGNVAKARYLRKVNNLAQSVERETGVPGTGYAHFTVQSKLAVLNGQLARAEQLLLQQGLVEETMEMYQELHKWEQSIAVAESRQHPEVQTLKANYLQWLTETGQEEKAAELKEREGDLVFAVRLFLKGGLPARAAAVVQRYEDREQFQPALLETVASALFQYGMYEKAGLFFEKLGDAQRAMDAYRKGSAFARAVELSRRAFQGRDVVELEEMWGDYLVSHKNADAAVNHFTEAGAYLKAIQAAIDCRQWAKAAQIVETLPPAEAKPYYNRIAKHYESTRSFDEAERFYLRAGLPQDAVEMYSKANKWELAHRVATEHMTQAEVAMLYITQAHRLEAASKFKDAERLYVMVHEPDLAINMYKKNRRYEDMIRLVTSYRKDLLTETHLHLAQQLETEGSFKLAEKHYVEASDWGSAVNMYRANDMWDDAIRVAKAHGGVNASKKVAYAWAVSLGGEAGAKLLTKFGLIDQAIDYATESGAFEHAFTLANASKTDKLAEVHLKYAMYLEDEGRFEEAEAEFLKADKPREAIDMYTHQQDWASATRVAETADHGSLPDVLCAQAKALVERNEFTKAEALYVRAKKPELAVEAYKAASRWNDAQRIAKEFLPHKVAELAAEHGAFLRGDATRGATSDDALLGPAKKHEEGREFGRAIDAYLKVTVERARSHELCEGAWDKAVQLAMNHVPARIAEVINTVSKRLVEIGKHDQAAELYEGIDQHREAIDIYMAGGLWDQARSLARSAVPGYAKEVEARHKEHLKGAGNAVDLVQGGNVSEGLEAYAQRGEWDRALELAQQSGGPMLVKYATLHGAALISRGEFAAAAALFGKYGVATQPQALSMYRRVVRELLVAGEPDDGGMGKQPLLGMRSMLHKVVAALQAAGDAGGAHEFDTLLWVGHLAAAKEVAVERGAPDAQRKLGIGLLRFVKDIPADQAFYEAGMACKASNDLNSAFVLLNRYLDITEAVEDNEPSSTVLDNADFADTAIPADFPLPEVQFLDEAKREQASPNPRLHRPGGRVACPAAVTTTLCCHDRRSRPHTPHTARPHSAARHCHICCPHPTPRVLLLAQVRDYVLELSMNKSVQQSLDTAELDHVFRQLDQIRESMRGGRGGGGGDELYTIVRDTVSQVS